MLQEELAGVDDAEKAVAEETADLNPVNDVGEAETLGEQANQEVQPENTNVDDVVNNEEQVEQPLEGNQNEEQTFEAETQPDYQPQVS